MKSDIIMSSTTQEYLLMASQHLTGTQLTSTPHLDGYLKGIRDEFDRLNHELEETRKQRDEFMTKCTS